MVWIPAAIAVAAILASVSIVDSHLITKRFPSLRALLLPVGILHVGFGIIVLFIYPLTEQASSVPLLVAIISGILRSIGALLFLTVMRSEEVSRIVPVVHTFTIFVVLFAVPILHENLNLTEWLSIFITVTGALLISIRFGAKGQGIGLRKSFVLLMTSSLLMGAANTASKYALDYVPFWNMFSIQFICFAVMFLLIALRPKVINELKGIKKLKQALALMTLNECMAAVGIMLSYWVIGQGPVSIVSTIFSIRPFFVFIFALLLSRTFPTILEEHFSKRGVLLKSASIGLIIGGVALLTLGQ